MNDEWEQIDRLAKHYKPVGGEGAGVRTPDLEAVRGALAILVDPKHGVMIQGLKSARWRIHRGDDLEGMANSAQEFSGDSGVYFSLNLFPADLGQPVDNKSVTGRRWFLIDIDPNKPNKNVNSSEAE